MLFRCRPLQVTIQPQQQRRRGHSRHRRCGDASSSDRSSKQCWHSWLIFQDQPRHHPGIKDCLLPPRAGQQQRPRLQQQLRPRHGPQQQHQQQQQQHHPLPIASAHNYHHNGYQSFSRLQRISRQKWRYPLESGCAIQKQSRVDTTQYQTAHLCCVKPRPDENNIGNDDSIKVIFRRKTIYNTCCWKDTLLSAVIWL